MAAESNSTNGPPPNSAFASGRTVAAWASDGRPADLAILNGRVATMNRLRPFARHLAVRDGLALAASDDEREIRRMEINAATGDVPCLINIHYAAVMVNKAALRVLGIDSNTQNPRGGLIQRNIRGKPTGLMIAEPNPFVVYSTIGRAPTLSRTDQLKLSAETCGPLSVRVSRGSPTAERSNRARLISEAHPMSRRC